MNYGADINTTDKDGDTPLHKSVHYNANDVLQLLLSREVIYTTWDSNGDSILHQAAKSGDLGMLQIIQNAGLIGIDPDALSRQGYKPLQLAEERITKPAGFAENFLEILVDIRTRNALLTRDCGEASGAMSENQVSNLSKWIRLTRTRSIIWKITVLDRIQGLQKSIQPMSHGSLPKAFWIYLFLSICVAGLAHVYSASGLGWAKQVLVLVWQVMGPTAMEEH